MVAHAENGFGKTAMRVFATALLAGTVLAAPAAAQKVPPTVYWISAATGEGGFSAVGMAGMDFGALIGAAMEGGNAQRGLTLQLWSEQPAGGAPVATHEVPPAMAMGSSLPLTAPPAEAAPAAVAAGPGDGEVEKPQGRITLYWGCGEKVRHGQPRVYDMAKMDQAGFVKAFSGRSSRQRAPEPGSGRSYGQWPVEDAAVPARASLQGLHRVSGNHTPEIRFSVGPTHDFMAPVRLTTQGYVAGPIVVSWETVPTAIGQFASVFAADDDGGIVLWSSSNLQEPGWGLHDFLPPADVEKWIKEGVLLGPRATSCTIPAGIFAQAGGAMLRVTAYGPELNIAHPEGSKNPQWTVKLRLKSTAMLPLDDGDDSEESPDDVPADAPGAEDTATEGPTRGYVDPAEALGNIKDAGNKLRGMFGR